MIMVLPSANEEEDDGGDGDDYDDGDLFES